MAVIDRERQAVGVATAGSEKRALWRGHETVAVWCATALVLYAALRGLFGALSKAFWFDEICTWIIARQPGMAAIWQALRHAADGNPPGFYLIERGMSHLVHNDQIAFRIPSILGFCCVLVCLFVFIRKRSGAWAALGCCLIPFITDLVGFTAEARPYSLLVACVAIALVCYQRAASFAWVALMAAALAFSATLHYYAVLALVPFGLAEFALLWQTRRVRWPVWLALVCGALPLAAFWPLAAAFRKSLGAHFWSKPSLAGLIDAYGDFLHIPGAVGFAIFGAMAVSIFLTLDPARREREGAAEPIPLHERVLILGLFALPFIAFVASTVSHGGFNTRYMLATVLGLPLAAGWWASRLPKSALVAASTFLVLAVGFQELAFWRSHPGRATSPVAAVEKLVNAAGHPDLPVVISAGINYLPIDYYASPQWKARFVALTDADKAIANAGNDSIESQLDILRAYAPLQTDHLATFAQTHPLFLLYSHRNALIGDWWPPELLRQGYSLQLVASDAAARVYLASKSR